MAQPVLAELYSVSTLVCVRTLCTEEAMEQQNEMESVVVQGLDPSHLLDLLKNCTSKTKWLIAICFLKLAGGLAES